MPGLASVWWLAGLKTSRRCVLVGGFVFVYWRVTAQADSEFGLRRREQAALGANGFSTNVSRTGLPAGAV